MNRRIFYGILLVIYSINCIGNYRWLVKSKAFIGNNAGSWQFHKQLAEAIFKEAPSEFGYYVYTPDQYGYSPRYAMRYVGKISQNQLAFPYTKKALVYLIQAPDSPDNPYTSANYWRNEKVRINKEPSKTITYANGYRIDQYQLNSEEIEVNTDPTIIQDMFFR